MSDSQLNRIAWLAIWLAFGLFCLFSAGAAYGIAWVRGTARVSEPAVLTATSGTVLAQPRGFGIWSNTRLRQTLREGDQIQTSADSSALIHLPDGSRLELFPDTSIRFETLQRGRFLPEIRETTLRVQSGVVRMEAVRPRSPKSRAEAIFPWGRARLEPGAYVIRTHDGVSELTTEPPGSATLISAAGQASTLGADQRALLYPGNPPEILPAKQNLLFDGAFSRPLADAWQVGVDRKFRGTEDALGEVDRVIVDGQPALYFRRTGSKGAWAETYARQNLEQPLAGYRSVKLRFDVKLVYQNVPGGGYLGSEYPFLVRLKFRNPRGEQIWVRGFYYQNDAGNPTNNGQPIERGQWVTYESPNLLREVIQPAESELVAIELTASGHDYASYVRNVEVIAE